jgi:polysaccharide biosynthesis protein PslH
MKILFITEKFPYPLDTGGNVRTYNILKGLAQEHEITLLSTISRRQDQDYTENLKDICKEIICIPVNPETRLRLGFAVAKSIYSNAPLPVVRHKYRAIIKQVKGLFGDKNGHNRRRSTEREENQAYDAIHFNHLDATVYLPYLPRNIIRVLDEHNIVSNQIRTTLGTEKNRLKWSYIRYELLKTESYESSVCQSMDRCIVCSDVDKRYLKSLAENARVVTIPNGVDIDFFSSPLQEDRHLKICSEANSMAFVGTLDYGPCDQGVKFFCRDIFPKIKREVPDATFLAIGRNPSKELAKIAEMTAGVTLTGWLPDVRPYVRAAKLFVVPLLSGSGTRLKILDAMAMNTAVVSTRIGAEGLETENHRNILIADDADQFAEMTIELLKNENKRKSIADEGNKLVRAKYSWQCIWKDLLQEYSLLNNGNVRTGL